MKKKLLAGLAVLAIAVVAAFNVSIDMQEDGLSDISLNNVEALASETSGCWGTTDWKMVWLPEYQRNGCQRGGEACCK